MSRSNRKLAAMIVGFAAILAAWIGCTVASHRVARSYQLTFDRAATTSLETSSLLNQANQIISRLGSTPDPAAFNRLNDINARIGVNFGLQRQLLAEETRLASIRARFDRAANVLLLVMSVYGVIPFFFGIRATRSRRAGLCVHCGYDLRASQGRCPECGEAVDPAT
jgi:hypothetical protein